ncbi:flavodoxin [Enterocloster bolteae]|uniref:flavodoxin n=1 Tax=Enterocloster bolteae TaxID=208479 RepID=UPI002A8068AA|nr:flavodoxin [Enterocloster bolteae]
MGKKIWCITCAGLAAIALMGCGAAGDGTAKQIPDSSAAETSVSAESTSDSDGEMQISEVDDGLVLITGGTFEMGSPQAEAWRSEDEQAHSVSVSDFYLSPYEVTQEEYERVMGTNPSTFSGPDLPVEMVSWLEAAEYCNARSVQEGLEPVYEIVGGTVSWNRERNGYRLPTEAEWEYACRAGTTTPFHTQTSISAEEANYWGDYPYMIEDNYFTQGNLETKPGVYRQTTTAVGSFAPNAWGLYDMHGNVGEWVWDYYGPYDETAAENPTGLESGTRRVNRGGGWNDFAKNLRSAYRAAMPEDNESYNIGFRLARNAVSASGSVVTSENRNTTDSGNGNMLIAYFSWGGNTRGIAQEIERQTGADLFMIEPVIPYSTDYNTVLDQAQRDQNEQARPELANHVEDISQYDIIFLGYPNWWASIPMPVATFLEEYDLAGKTIIPFCSHGGGRFGQSLTAIAKLAPDAEIGEGLAVSYSGGSGLADDVAEWLEENKIEIE